MTGNPRYETVHMAEKTTKRPARPSARASLVPNAAGVVLLSGGNPQIAEHV